MTRLLLLITLLITATAQAADDTAERIDKALTSAARSAEDIARDDNRRPAQTLAYFGLRHDMRVLELLPGGGWYTKILAPVLAEDGQLYVGLGTRRVEANLLDQPGFERVRALKIDAQFERNGPFGTNHVGPLDFGVKDLDMVLTFRNMHNFTPEGRSNINKAVLAALKSGGVYGVVDHTARHMEPMTAENRRRLDPIVVIRELTALGFLFEGFSDLHYRPDDELRYEVGRRSVTGNSDRFTLLFRKP